MSHTATQTNTGTIKQIIGAVVDVYFENKLPEIFEALEIKKGDSKVVLETQQHIGSNIVRAIAMSSTDGLSRGQEVIATGEGISVPVGEKTLGRLLSVLGEPIDNKGEVKSEKKYPIHRPSPAFISQSTKTEILETGIKVIDLICPIPKGGKVGMF
ncbi:MAG: F0F1 ATP synthase subunit beta, partial [Candidatus Portnoybacteria bacterium]|nr:F0F1 ATP synthase subunit beta [Candidatus Portnoybacteria bacterium]